MRYLLLLIALCVTEIVPAQERPAPDKSIVGKPAIGLPEAGKGVTPLSAEASAKAGTTYAVVVGISDYQDAGIPDLRFAHTDAQAFAAYLQSPAGGSLPNDQITLLTNAQATAGKIIAAFDWLLVESKPGDRALIYFSGHGDVERLTKFQRGYLLCHDAPGTTYMAGGSLAVGSLEDIINTLSEAGVQVVMISDACRSGKLAGSENGGTQATTASLAQQFSNEIKILSCQPEEFSLEGEEWGGGRGCFSFHLVDALTGLADANADGSVNLLETGRYLEEKVPAETAPHQQIPMTVGNKSAALAAVMPEALAAVQGQKKGAVSTLSPIDAKGFEDMVLAKADTSVQRLYAAFIAALERGDLMSPPGASANDYYEQLLPRPGIDKLKGLMTRNLAAALQDEAQVVINQLLRTDPEIVDDAFSPVSKYDHLPAYLHRAGNLLGEGHYMYRFIKAREYYFKAKACRKANFPELTPDSLLNLALGKLDTALLFDDEAAYAWFEKGYLQYWHAGGHSLPMASFQKACIFSPGWVLSNYFAGVALRHTNPDSANFFLQEALRLDSFFLPAYRDMGASFDQKGNVVQAKFWFEQYVRKMEEYLLRNGGKAPVIYYNYLGNSLVVLGKYAKAEEALLKGETLSNGQFPQIYNNLAWLYEITGAYDKAESVRRKALVLLPLHSFSYWTMGDLKYFHQNRPAEEAIPWYQKAVQLGSIYFLIPIAQLYLQTGQLDSAEITAKSLEAAFPDDPETELLLAKVQRKKGDSETAKTHFLKMESLTPDFEKEKKNFPDFYFKTIAAIQTGTPDSLARKLEQWRKETAGDPAFCFEVAKAFGCCQDIPAALDWLELAFQNGWKLPLANAHEVFRTLDFMEVRKDKRFKRLMKKYFPDHPNL